MIYIDSLTHSDFFLLRTRNSKKQGRKKKKVGVAQPHYLGMPLQARPSHEGVKSYSFSDILVSAVVANMFPYLEKRTDWNNFALSPPRKYTKGRITEQKDLTPPWPEGKLIHIQH
jgi:hypothetical protein